MIRNYATVLRRFPQFLGKSLKKSSHSRYKLLTINKNPFLLFHGTVMDTKLVPTRHIDFNKQIKRVMLLGSTLITQSRENLRSHIMNHRIRLKSQELLPARLNTIKFHSFAATVLLNILRQKQIRYIIQRYICFLRSYVSLYTQTVLHEGGQTAQLRPLFQSVVDRSSR
jgi:UDP-2,3-diacylglucosamine pyrophosphatase LpxH